MQPIEKFQQMRADLTASLIERDQEIDLCLTALVAREHVLLVGPPGTAKSMLSDAIVKWLDGSRFQILLTKFTTPEEVFGPVSLAGLKTDHYRRITTGKLPAADVAFVDEIFKASSAILNTLLTILNERKFDNDGTRHTCPLQLCVAASNEWPGSNGDGKELGALFDRFLLRKSVQPIASARGLDRLLWAPAEVSLSDTLSPDELDQAQREAAALPWTDKAKEAFHAILREAKSEGIIPGDRRMRKAVGVGQAYAWLQGHAAVENDDLEILAAVLWDDPTEQPAKLAKIVGTIANPEGMKINTLLIEAEEIIGSTDLKDLAQTATACKKLSEVHAKLTAAPGAKAASAAAHVASEVKRIRLASVEAL
jgi:MoxR-like ATPase